MPDFRQINFTPFMKRITNKKHKDKRLIRIFNVRDRKSFVKKIQNVKHYQRYKFLCVYNIKHRKNSYTENKTKYNSFILLITVRATGY